MEPQNKRVYVAGPYTKGNTAINVANAIKAAHTLMDAGLVPFVPHLSHFWELMYPRPREEWLNYDNIWLSLCGSLLRLPGESAGSDDEVILARELGTPVFNSIAACLEAYERVFPAACT